MEDRKLRYGMVGGGEGSFIGNVHRKALGLTAKAELKSGCFDINQENNIFSGLKYGVSEDRIYHDFIEMAECESKREDRIDFVVITTPNNLHYEVAKEFLSKGFHVVCEKPLCFKTEEAYELKKIAEENEVLLCISYTYVGYPMAKQMKSMIRNGDIGEITVIMAEYAQDWMGHWLTNPDSPITGWRNNPEINGKAGSVGDIGSHIECFVSYVTGLKIESLCANLRVVGEAAKLDTNAEILVRFNNGASGMYWCSQIAHGYSNGLKIRIFGTKGSIEWDHEYPDKLKVSMHGKPISILTQGKNYLEQEALRYCRLPAGHPEGFYEAFANIYEAFITTIRKKITNEEVLEHDLDFAGIEEGIGGVKFVNACLESNTSENSWIRIN
jgi:predicted dehydrogenase